MFFFKSIGDVNKAMVNHRLAVTYKGFKASICCGIHRETLLKLKFIF